MRYRIEVAQHLGSRFVSRLDGAWSTVETADGAGSVLVGEIADQADLFAVLLQLQQLGIALVSIEPAGDGSS